MASSKISELVDAGNLLPGDETIIVRNGANFKVDPTINAVNAWVNFNGTGTVAIRASYNVSSITDRGTGLYTVNFTTAMPDLNYCGVASAIDNITVADNRNRMANAYANTTSAAYTNTFDTSGSADDVEQVNVVFVR